MARLTGRAYTWIILVCLLFVMTQVSAVTYPRPTGYVNDFAQVISAQARQEIETVGASLKQGGNIEMAVVTVRSLEGLAIEDYSIGLAEAWGVGTSAEDLGIILLLAVNERQVRIEVGYGLEGDLPDGLVGEILDTHVVPDFRNNNFSQGMLKGSRAIAATLADRRNFTLQQVRLDDYVVKESTWIDEIQRIFVFLLFLIFIIGRGRLWPLLFIGRRGRRYHGGGGFGSSSRGGGFGGFSGGGFGGGGASRSF